MIHGKDSLKNYVKAIFEKNEDLYFVRETLAVTLNKTTDLAWETGRWKGLRPETPGWTTVGGKYAAMWLKKDGEWKIRSQLFVRLY